MVTAFSLLLFLEQTWQSLTYQRWIIASLVGIIVATAFIYLARPTNHRAGSPGIWTLGIIVAFICFGMVHLLLGTMPRRMAHINESNALGVLENLYKAQFKFREKTHRFGTLADLANEGLVGQPLAAGKTIWGYKFTSSDVTDKTFCIHADRVENTSGFRDFNITETEDYRSIKSDIRGTVPHGQGQDAFDYSK